MSKWYLELSLATLHYTNFTEKWTDARYVIGLSLQQDNCFISVVVKIFFSLSEAGISRKLQRNARLCFPYVKLDLPSLNQPINYSRVLSRKIHSSLHCATAPTGPRRPHFRGFTITLRYTHTLSRTPLDEWSARRRHLYLTTHNTHKRQTSMPLAVFEPAISAIEMPQTYAWNRAANGTGHKIQSASSVCSLSNLTHIRVP
jgi:hypothetical protein